MKAYGSKRTYARCRIVRAGQGRKPTVKVVVKNSKRDRAAVVACLDLLVDLEKNQDER